MKSTGLWPLLLLVFLVFRSSLPAHVVTRGAGTACVVTIQESKILLTFDLGFSAQWAQGEMVSMDTDHNGEVGEAEARVYMDETWEGRIAPHLKVIVNGTELVPVKVSSREAYLLGQISPTTFDIYYKVEADLAPVAGLKSGPLRLEIHNFALENESPSIPVYYLPMSPESHALGNVLHNCCVAANHIDVVDAGNGGEIGEGPAIKRGKVQIPVIKHLAHRWAR